MVENKTQSINIEISEEIAEGVYTNLAIISHSNAEFIIDFINIMPGTQKSKVKARVILAPLHAKKLLQVLSENVANFEAQHGKIKDDSDGPIGFNLGLPTAQA